MPNPNPKRTAKECGANRSNGRGLCKAPAMANGRCRVHGGAVPKGVAHHSYRHGLYSKHLQGTPLGVMVDEALADPDRLSMEEELALVDARIQELLQELNTPASSAAWGALQQAIQEFEAAQAKKSVQGMHRAFTAIQDLSEKGVGRSAAWAELRGLIDQRKNLVESEERRALASGKAIPAERVRAVIAALSQMILDEVPDPKARRRLAERVVAMVQGNHLGGAKALPASVQEAIQG